jgi:UDP-N-acetylglucosamine diphosphorylase/glucosamine-1-phosphate N-acetyltransferase
MNIVLFDHPILWEQLLPMTFTRPIAEMRVGIFTLTEKWGRYTGSKQVSWITEEYLSAKYPSKADSDTFFIASHVIPTEKLVKAVGQLSAGKSLKYEDTVIALRGSVADFNKIIQQNQVSSKSVEKFTEPVVLLNRPYDIFTYNAAEIVKDIELLKKSTKFFPLDDKHSATYNASEIYIEEGVKVRAAILNAEDGPIYLGKNTQVQEGGIIKGTFALCEGSIVNMGGKMRPGSTIGPYSKVGGEISNAVFFGYSNKGHDGFLGNAVIGEWCNLGADTNASNMKNNYSEVKLWNYATKEFEKTGLQFCGLIMGDHSKAGINTMFNTGTSVGVSCNIFDGIFPPTVIPSFSWGGGKSWKPFRLEKAIETANRVLVRRNQVLSDVEKEILKYIFEQERRLRRFDLFV